MQPSCFDIVESHNQRDLSVFYDYWVSLVYTWLIAALPPYDYHCEHLDGYAFPIKMHKGII